MKVLLHARGPLELNTKQPSVPWGEYAPGSWDWTLKGVGFQIPDKTAIESQLLSLHRLDRPNLMVHVVIGVPDEDKKTITIPPEGFVVSIVIPRLSLPPAKNDLVVFEHQGGQLLPDGQTLEEMLAQQVAAIQKEIEGLQKVIASLVSTEGLPGS